MDVNRHTNILTSYHALRNETITFANLLESPNYLSTDKFDLITYSQEAMNTTLGSGCGWWKRLMGSCKVSVYRDINDDGSGCVEYDVKQEYLLGFQIGKPYVDTYNERPCVD